MNAIKREEREMQDARILAGAGMDGEEGSNGLPEILQSAIRRIERLEQESKARNATPNATDTRCLASFSNQRLAAVSADFR